MPLSLLTDSAAEAGRTVAPRGRFQSQASDALMWAVLVAGLAALFLMFRTFVVRELAWAYPADYDQTKYLSISYAAYERVLSDGLPSGLKDLFGTPYSNGMLIHVHALLLMLVFGASRLTVLSVNYVTLALYVAVTAGVVRRLTDSRWTALMAAGLAIGSGAYWFRNLTDYRLDFSSVCLFGLFVALVMRSRVFRESRWAWAAGVLAAMLVMNRFLTALYVAGIYGGMLVYFGLVGPWLLKRREPAALRNTAVSAVIGAGLSLPVVWTSGQAIYDYYVVEQGRQQSVRAVEFAVDGLLQSWLYYPKSVLVDHVGLSLVLVSLLVLGVGAAARWSGTRRAGPSRAAGPAWLTDGWVFLGLALCVIIGALTLNITRSPIVGGTAVPLFTWAIILGAITLLRPGLHAGDIMARRAAALSAVLALGVTMYSQVAFFGKHYSFWNHRADTREIARMYGDIGRYAEEMEWSQAVVGSDSVRDYLLAPAVTAVQYESSGRLVSFSGSFGAGGGVLAPPREALLAQMDRTDFLILTHRNDAAEPPYPLVQALDSIRPEMEEAARSKLLPLGEYLIFGRLVNLYARPVPRIVHGVSGGWITEDGLLVEVPNRVASMRPAEVVITGGMNPWIGSDVAMTCASGQDGSASRLAASFVVRDNWYVGRCALPAAVAGEGPLRVRLSFSKYFVPRDKGINEDVRRLVVLAPVRTEVLPRRPAQ